MRHTYPTPSGGSVTLHIDPALQVEIDYTNWRDVRGTRVIQPISMSYARSEFHPDYEYVVLALDVAKNQLREFAMKDIHSWKPVKCT